MLESKEVKKTKGKKKQKKPDAYLNKRVSGQREERLHTVPVISIAQLKVKHTVPVISRVASSKM